MNLKISSEKLNNPYLVDLLGQLSASFLKMNRDFFVIGATARDIVVQQLLDMSSRRKTRDLDLAIAITNWQEYGAVKDALVADGFYQSEEYMALAEQDQVPPNIEPQHDDASCIILHCQP